tara:strand:+ start:437 stop:1507 length:1071 start_codon:yes stop_codon:yes gene_type:complete
MRVGQPNSMMVSDLGAGGIIGGVFALEAQPPGSPRQSVLSAWTDGAAAIALFHNARSAVRHAVRDFGRRRFWLPAYVCPELACSVQGLDAEIHYYPVGGTLEPDTGFLADELEGGDVVLGINYFGRSAVESWRDLIDEVEGVLWIEDCAQALSTGGEHYGDIRIYSARKLMGAPDGGVLVDVHGKLTPPDLVPLLQDDFVEPYRLRRADAEGRMRPQWFQAFRAAELGMVAGNEAMSAMSEAILNAADIGPMIDRRSENYSYLHNELGEVALFRDSPRGWAPLGFPMVSSRCDALCAFLADRLIFAPRHWPALPCPGDRFPTEHRLSTALVTLPCDQRYGLADMERVVAAVKAFAP